MGKPFSKDKAEKCNPRNVGSTQSLNFSRSVISPNARNVGPPLPLDLSCLEISPNPHNVGSTQHPNLPKTSHNSTSNSYDQPVRTQTLLRNQPLPTRQRRNSLFPVPVHPFQGETMPFLPWQSPPPPLSDSSAENRRPSAPESDDDYPVNRTGKEKSVSDNVYDSTVSSSKQEVRAEWNYEANHDSDISIRKGDILQLSEESETIDWYFAKNLTTGKEGYVPKDWITLIAGKDVESQKYFFKRMDREEATERLSEPGVENGTYLLRPSGDACSYALSLLCESELYEAEIRHYKVRIAERGICYIETDSGSRPFANITKLIKYYTDKPGLRCNLKFPLPQDSYTIHFSDLKLGDVLGSGNFGSVYAGTLNKNKQVAVKSLKEQGSMTVEQFRNEAETMRKLHHQNLVSLLGICEYRGRILIVTERMSNGTLLNLLRQDNNHTVKFKDIMQMSIQVLDGMCYLEKKGFVHRDLRAANVLVGDGYVTKIADFGLARLLNSYYEHENFYEEKKGAIVPYKWTAPEAIKQLRFTVKSDVWSFGILLYEIVTHGDEPYAGMSNAEVLEWLEKGNRLKRPKESPATLYNIMKLCWMIRSDDRPNFADIKETLVEIETKA